ncbi:MAG: 16S rRNA (uracil(1498)-N(3))-methyltransferase [Verrucomicrobia subdivision 3 bacterium]|nr:16S rRNA (uracil(1498)-N(3))-methyltransferase [Limisphaerales bacterium]
MHRFYIPPEQCRDAVIELTDTEAHHALRVLRLQTGERVTVLDGVGQELLCKVRTAARHTVTLAVLHRNTSPPLPCQITLLQAVPKAKAMDYIIQKATELGAARVVPILSERTVIQLDGEDAADKAEKWQQIAIESIKQCGSPWLTKIEPPVTLKNYLARREKFDLPLIASLQDAVRHPREFIQHFRDEHNRLPTTAGVWIGPEGDFSPAEMNVLKAAGALPMTLGRLVLRSDTAAIYSLSVLHYELQD